MKMSPVELVLLFVVTVFGCCTSDETKWTWRDSDKNSQQPEPRYAVDEYQNDFNEGFKPHYPGPYGPGGGPIGPANDPGILVGPGGPTGIINRPNGGHRFRRPHYHEYDNCKCSYSFNCPDLVFGSCGAGKRYCCTSGSKFHGAAPVGYPGLGSHAYYPEKRPNYYGPVNFSPSTNNYGRPPYNGGYQFPGHYRPNRGNIGFGLDRQTNGLPGEPFEDDVAIFARSGKDSKKQEEKSS